MQIATLQAEPRKAAGTRAARRLRREGKLPAIIYGHGETPEPVAVPVHDLQTLLDRGTHVLELRVDGAPRQVLIKDVQFDHLEAAPVHVDFTRIDLNERVKVRVPLDFKGTPAGVNEGGLFEHDELDIEVEALATQIPDSIRVNVGHLGIGQSLHVRDLELPPDVKAVTAAETIVCSVRVKAAAVEEVVTTPEEAAAQEPEIIGRKEKAEAEEAEAPKPGKEAKTKEKEKE